MNITVELLIKAGIGPTQAKDFAAPLQAACDQFAINTPLRISAFLAHGAHESIKFTRLEENLYYVKPDRIRQVFGKRIPTYTLAESLARYPKALANTVYANRLGNGDAQSNDGWTYRGRGIFQLTGRDNYRAAGDALRQPYVNQPELVCQPEHAAMTAAWFWSERGCNADADKGDMRMTTGKINGPAMLGLAERSDLCNTILIALT